MGLTEEQLVAHAATTGERVQVLVELGILTKEADSDEPFEDGAVQRVRLVEELEALGIPPARVAAASPSSSQRESQWMPGPGKSSLPSQ